MTAITYRPGKESPPRESYVVKTANETLTSSSAFQADDELQLPLLKGRYAFEAAVFFQVTDATPGFKWRLQPTGGATISGTNDMHIRLGFLPSTLNERVSSTFAESAGDGINTSTLNTPHSLLISGVFECTAAGFLAFEWAQLTSDANAIQVNGNSWMQLTKLD